jgi:hypothetical protein
LRDPVDDAGGGAAPGSSDPPGFDKEPDVSTAPPELDDIRKRMAQIRRDLHEDVKGVVEGAEAATDWRRFIRNYPWASMGVAVFAGYLIVPRKHRATTTIQMAPAEIARAVAPEPPKPTEAKKGKGLLGTVFGLVAPFAFKAAQGYALQFAEQWMAQKLAQQMAQHPEMASAFGMQNPEPQGPRVSPPGFPRF